MTFRYRKTLATILERVAEPGDQQEAIFSFDEVNHWPANAVEPLLAAKLLKEVLPAEAVTCRGCEEHCRRPITFVNLPYGPPQAAISTCHLFRDMGPFEQPLNRLRRWAGSRELVARFVGRAGSLNIKDRDEQWRRVRFGTLQVRDLRRAFSIEFDCMAKALIGSSSLPLIDLLEWNERGIALDLESLTDCAAQSEDKQSGNRRVQPSVTVREDRKRLTDIRNRSLQRRLNELAKAHRTLSKYQLAKKIEKSSEFPGMTVGTIARVTKMPEKK